MAKLFMVRTPGTKDYPGLSHLLEARVFDNVAKEDATRLIAAGLAEEFDPENETHAQSIADYGHLDAKKPMAKTAAPAAAPAVPVPAPKKDVK